jgi:hypothetical protein
VRRADHGFGARGFLLSDNVVVKMLGFSQSAWRTLRWLDKIMPPITIEGCRVMGCKTAGAATRLTAR